MTRSFCHSVYTVLFKASIHSLYLYSAFISSYVYYFNIKDAATINIEILVKYKDSISEYT